MRTQDVQIFEGSVNANGDSFDNPINVKNASEVVLFLDVTEANGATPGLIVYLMTKDEISGKWFLIGNFDTKESMGTDHTYIINGLGSSIACKWAVTGVDPQFTFALNASIKD